MNRLPTLLFWLACQSIAFAVPPPFEWDVTHVYGSAMVQTEARLTSPQQSLVDTDREPPEGLETWDSIGSGYCIESSNVESSEPGNASEVYAAGTWRCVSTVGGPNPLNFGFLADAGATGIVNLDAPDPYYQGTAMVMPCVHESGIMGTKDVRSDTTHYTVKVLLTITAEADVTYDERIDGPKMAYVQFGENASNHKSYIWAYYDPGTDQWTVWYQQCSLSGTQHIVEQDSTVIAGYENIHDWGFYHRHRSAVTIPTTWTVQVNYGRSWLSTFADNYYGGVAAEQDISLGCQIDYVDVDPY